MKILHLIYTSSISGAEKYLKNLLPGLRDYGIDAHLIIVCPKESYQLLKGFAVQLGNEGVPTTLMIASRLTFVMAAGKINNYCKSTGIKIIHSHLVNSDLIAVLVKKIFNRRIFIVSTKHGYEENVLQVYEPGKTRAKKNLYFIVTKYLQKSIDKNVAVSKGISELYFNLGLTKTRFPVLYHGITVPDFNPADFANSCRFSEIQLIIVGRIEKFKGHHFLVEAMQEVIKIFPACKLIILGDGDAKRQLESQVQSLNIEQNVEFLGFQPHPYSYISNSDVVVLPSLFEPFGLVYIEAFALQVPIVAFDTPAGNEIMEDNVTALMVPRGNVSLLAEKIIWLLRNKSERERLSQNAYQTYKNRFTSDKMIENTAKWYHDNLA